MLVLSRRSGESLRIGGEVRLTVLGVSGGQVRIGISAPAHVAVHREEVLERIEESNREAASPRPEILESLVQRLGRSQPGGTEGP